MTGKIDSDKNKTNTRRCSFDLFMVEPKNIRQNTAAAGNTIQLECGYVQLSRNWFAIIGTYQP